MMTFTCVASHLMVRNIPTALRILPHTEQHIIVDLPDISSAPRLSIWQEGGTLLVEGTATRCQRGRACSCITCQNTVLHTMALPTCQSGNEEGAEDEAIPLLTILVPQTTSVAVSNVAGYTSIGDTEGLLLLTTSPLSGPVSIGRVSGGTILLEGNGHVLVEEVCGEALQLTVLGMGTIDIQRGHVPLLSAAIEGVGRITFAGAAAVATLLIKGTGTIEVGHVAASPLCIPGHGIICADGVLRRSYGNGQAHSCNSEAR